ncbi:MAG: polysaccharide deacetylase family protein [Evtepia gabavorous]
MSLIVKVGKAGKRVVKKFLPEEKHHVSYTRRIERVKTRERVVAMTFDDGPMDLPSSPDKFDGKALTDILLDTLGEYGAQGTFDVVGDTSENYPDTAGKSGQADWGGVRYDHYPDINQDERGGAVHNQRLLRRMLDEGHQVTNHGYRHVLFGKKPFVYGKRDHFHGLDQVVSDLTRLHTLLKETYGYEMTMARPPHYVDKIEGGFTSYDAYDQMGYLYLAAAFDGAGWLPLHHGSAQESLRAEVEAMVDPMRKVLEADPDGLAGQIIFQKERLQHVPPDPGGLWLRKAAGAAEEVWLSGGHRPAAHGVQPLCRCGPGRPRL